MKFNKIQEIKNYKIEVIKAKIISSEGSVPSETGNYMLISEKDIFGTIGGGHLEYLIITKKTGGYLYQKLLFIHLILELQK